MHSGAQARPAKQPSLSLAPSPSESKANTPIADRGPTMHSANDQAAGPTPALPQLLITAPEAARLLAVSDKTLWTMTRDGRIRSVKIGSRGVRYNLDSLRAFIAEAEGNQP